MGNLTLLTQELNSSISNGPFVDKSTAIAADSDLRLNAHVTRRPNIDFVRGNHSVAPRKSYSKRLPKFGDAHPDPLPRVGA